MYIEQGRKGELGLWKYLFPTVGFLGFMLINIITAFFVVNDVDAMMQKQIDSMGKPLFLLINLLFFIPLLGGLFFWVKVVHKQQIRTLTSSRKKVDWKRVFFMFGLMSVFVLIITCASYMLSPSDYELNFKPVPFMILAVMAIILIPIQTSFEEYMFRGYMLQGLGLATKTRWIPLVVTSVLFGLMHMANPEVGKLGPVIMVYYIGTGFFLAIMTLMDEGLELALGFHAANNLMTALLVTSTWTAFQTDSILISTGEPVVGFDILIPVFVVFPIFLLILTKKYKWSGWKDKLFGKVLLESNAEE